MNRRYLLAPVLLVFVFTFFRYQGCGHHDNPEPSLEAFESCDALEQFIEDTASTQLTYTETNVPDEPTLLFLLFGCADSSMVAMDEGGDGFSGSIGGGGENDHSSTNLQEFDVDEADFVKNDGDYIYVVNGDELVIVDAWPADEMAEVARQEIEGYVVSMYYHGDIVVALSYLASGGVPLSGHELGISGDVTKTTIIDIADRENPVVHREIYTEGRLVTSRRIGDQLTVITHRDFTRELDLVGTDVQIASAIHARTLDDWMSHTSVVTRDGEGWDLEEDRSCGCEAVYRPAKETGLGMYTVLATDITDMNSEVVGTSVVSGEADVYVSPENLYLSVAEPTAGAFSVEASLHGTRLHKFELGEGSEAPIYRASGKVPGTVLNSWSMDEARDTFRIATTREDSETGMDKNGVYILEQADDRLEIIGEIDNLIDDEEIYAVRWFDDVGYVVTFPSIEMEMVYDPLFTIDLADQTNPIVRGELEITGYSRYLHPLGDDHLIAIGEEVEPSTNWITGLSVSLFDVSDLDAPTLQERHNIETGENASEALRDHHAFQYYTPHDMLAIPVTVTNDWGEIVQYAGLHLYRVTAEQGILLEGAIDSSELVDPSINGTNTTLCAQVRRAVFIENAVYAVSSGGIIAAPVEQPELTLATVAFPDHGNCDEPWLEWEGTLE